ncbi:Uncharacterized protein OBRU01_02201 [Operophtera brumata]|uniref:Uncharacterized protein n=1 Tax=Operophtera brumata TaxID=104452 RepID=A0A0L7LT27_OPEBR|nr:Uncharacterized protein OBRU01_02201 [Operophtera brumata]
MSAVQAKQARRLDDIQDKLDRVETTLTLKLERAQLAAERLEHRLHMLQTNVQVNGAYADTWHRGLVLEALMRDGLSLVNVTRRELADGLRALGRRQRDARLTSGGLEASFARQLSDNTDKINLKMQEVIDMQKRLVDSCQPVQQDDPNKVANALEKLVELQTIKANVREHDTTVMKVLNTARPPQLTEKFVDLTNRADAALQQLERKISEEMDMPSPAADKDSYEDFEYDIEDDAGYSEDGESDMMAEDKQILDKASERDSTSSESTTTRPTHRRHLHKHPYDRGPTWRKPSLE